MVQPDDEALHPVDAEGSPPAAYEAPAEGPSLLDAVLAAAPGPATPAAAGAIDVEANAVSGSPALHSSEPHSSELHSSELHSSEPHSSGPRSSEPHSSELHSSEPHSSGPRSSSWRPSLPLARPSFVFFGVVAALALVADIATKVWAEMTLNQRGFEPLEIIADHVSITLAYNRGGAWGLFSTADDLYRKPFFLAVSVAAIAFIISLYSKLHVGQKALKWGLPLVLGGALGNLSDRITRSQVIDFIDYRADWVMSTNALVQKYVPAWTVTDHWPTFNVADIAICIGVGLMAVDMFTHRPRRVSVAPPARLESVRPPALG